MTTAIKPQLELSFEQTLPAPPETRPQRRLRRARWWFDQMRHVVDRALERHPGPGRTEQTYLTLSNGRWS